jgi:hypothetical protein
MSISYVSVAPLRLLDFFCLTALWLTELSPALCAVPYGALSSTMYVCLCLMKLSPALCLCLMELSPALFLISTMFVSYGALSGTISDRDVFVSYGPLSSTMPRFVV